MRQFIYLLNKRPWIVLGGIYNLAADFSYYVNHKLIFISLILLKMTKVLWPLIFYLFRVSFFVSDIILLFCFLFLLYFFFFSFYLFFFIFLYTSLYLIFFFCLYFIFHSFIISISTFFILFYTTISSHSSYYFFLCLSIS